MKFEYLNLKFFVLFICISSFMWSQNKATYTYAKKDSEKLKLDVYTPENLKKNDSLPVVLWMHGGGFSGGNRDNHDEVKMMKYLTENGYIGISISYRLLLKNSETGSGCDCPKTFKLDVFRQAAIDYLDAAKYVVENKEQLQIDTTKIIAGGSSAGAEGVLNAVYLKNFFVDDVSVYNHVNFAGVISLAGALVDSDYISKDNAVPTVLFHGTDDNLVPVGKAPHHYCTPDRLGYLILEGSEIIADKLHDLEASYYYHKVVGGRHELCQIPFNQLDQILDFFNQTIQHKETVQTKKTLTKKP
ncbi:alpha/beta hydrolase [Algibacter sp. 2305UL17-15]|uniref:alpha/beta hydrolase n=1 Tax=Algibacter sp. 2305UL17-15 TaxID=3231268 RepID=UPI00345B4389